VEGLEATLGDDDDTVYATVDQTLSANVEVLRAAVGSTGLVLTGSAVANTIMGGAGGDRLAGAGGRDALFGGVGADTFVFDAGLSDANVVRIGVFAAGLDAIELSAAVFFGPRRSGRPERGRLRGQRVRHRDPRRPPHRLRDRYGTAVSTTRTARAGAAACMSRP
jgi:Ca2+-binding RTX toxin-like protein